MKWKKTLLKTLKVAAISALSLFAVTLGQQILAMLKDRPDMWAVAATAVIYALLDWLKHRRPDPWTNQ